MSRLFPKSLRVGLDLNSARIQMVGLQAKGKAFALEFFEIVDLIKEYNLESAENLTDNHYIEQLKKLAAEHNLKGTKISAVLPAGSAIIQILQVAPSQTESELLEKIQYELKQLTHENLEEMQITCQELDDEKSGSDKIPLLVCAMPVDVVQRFKRIISGAGLKLNVLDLDAFGVYNAFSYFSVMKFGPTAIVQVGDEYSVCLIMLPGRAPFFHVIKLGSRHLNNAAGESTDLQRKTVTTESTAENSRWSDLSFFQSLSPQPVRSPHFQTFSTEVRKCIRHIQSHEGISNFDKIFLSGGGQVLNELADTFERTLGIEAKIWNPILQFTNGHNAPQRKQFASGIFLTPAIGTALCGY